MKGLVAKQSGDTVHLATKYYCICEISRKPREGFEAIKVPDISSGEEITKYIKRYDLEGIVTKIEWRDTKQEYEVRYQSWRIHVDANGTPVILEIKWKSAPSDRFMKVAENINFAKPVEFRAWQGRNQKTGKPQAAFAIFQDGNNVPAKYKQGDMGECPEAVEDLDGWDFRAQLKFLHSQMLHVVIPKVDAIEEGRSAQRAHPVTEDEADDWGAPPPIDDDDDVPF